MKINNAPLRELFYHLPWGQVGFTKDLELKRFPSRGAAGLQRHSGCRAPWWDSVGKRPSMHSVQLVILDCVEGPWGTAAVLQPH